MLVVVRTKREPKGPPFAGAPLLLEAEVPGPEWFRTPSKGLVGKCPTLKPPAQGRVQVNAA